MGIRAFHYYCDGRTFIAATELQQIFADPDNSFEQVIIQVGSNLRYDALMKVVDICTRLKLPNGQKLSKLSFVEVPEG